MKEDLLLASGIRKAPEAEVPFPRSRLLIFYLEAESIVESVSPRPGRGSSLELSRKGMAVVGDHVYFLPEDLGAENRLFCLRLGPKKGS